MQSMVSSSSPQPAEDPSSHALSPDLLEVFGPQTSFYPSQDDGGPSSFTVSSDISFHASGGRGYARPAARQTGRVRGQDNGPERQAVGLYAFIKPAKNKRGGKRGGGSAGNTGMAVDEDGTSSTVNEAVSGDGVEAETETSLCPVCGEFEGDAAAVAHHVAGHFGD